MSATKIPAMKIRAVHGCPKCGEDLTRISKSSVDRLIALLIPIGRYKCYRCLREFTRIL